MAMVSPEEPLPVVEQEQEALFRIPGVTQQELLEALGAIRLLRRVGHPDTGSLEVVRHIAEQFRAVQAEAAAGHREALYRVMADIKIDPVPWATVAQARRLAASRRRLLASGAFTTTALQEMHADRSPNTTRTWIARQRERGALFTVEVDGATLVPAFLLDPSGAPRAEVRSPLAVLRNAGLSGWELWTWFASGSPWLSARAPSDVLADSPQAVEQAAQAFAANLG